MTFVPPIPQQVGHSTASVGWFPQKCVVLHQGSAYEDREGSGMLEVAGRVGLQELISWILKLLEEAKRRDRSTIQ
jgi:hypothetical protein